MRPLGPMWYHLRPPRARARFCDRQGRRTEQGTGRGTRSTLAATMFLAAPLEVYQWRRRPSPARPSPHCCRPTVGADGGGAPKRAEATTGAVAAIMCHGARAATDGLAASREAHRQQVNRHRRNAHAHPAARTFARTLSRGAHGRRRCSSALGPHRGRGGRNMPLMPLLIPPTLH